jgi:serine/threonine protein kinase
MNVNEPLIFDVSAQYEEGGTTGSSVGSPVVARPLDRSARRPGRARSVAMMEETVLHVAAYPASHVEPARRLGCGELIGRRIDQYEIESLLGRGSMACVYKARHLGLHRACALKVMDHTQDAIQPSVQEQFWAEARAAANLVHPNVVTIHNMGSADGYHFIEMEHVPGGQTLRETLVREGPIEPIRASMLTRQVVLALGAAHDSGLVHRDIKPANVLLTPDGEAKLADFGLVRRFDDLAKGGAPLAGTPTFMAPELFQGIPSSPRSDIYAVGVLLYYTLSGQLPFVADSISELVQLHRDLAVPNIRKIVPAMPEALAEIVERCLAKSPDERFSTAVELADALETTVTRLRDTERLVRESVEGLDCFVQGSHDTFRVILHLPENRMHEVIIEATEKDHERHLSVFSICGPADPSYFAFALTINAHLTYGSISIRPVLGAAMFVMSRTFLRETVSVEDIRLALLEIARRADSIEKQLTRQDQY